MQKFEDDPLKLIQKFFKSLSEDPSLKKAIKERARRVEDAIRDDVLKEDVEEVDQERLNIDQSNPVDVLKSLPKNILECFASRDINQLHHVLSNMEQLERDYYLKQLFKSGLLVPSSSSMQTNDNEQNTTTDENMGNEKMDAGKEESNEDGQEGAIKDEQVLID